MDALLADCCAELTTAIGRLSLLSAHDALILFKTSFSAPKMMHTMRCSPCTNHPSLEVYDILLRKGISVIANLDLSVVQWLQASLSLPVKDGGLGVRRVTSLAPSAFLASAAGTATLQQQLLLRSPTFATADAAVSLISNVWSSAHNSPCPTGLAAYRQSAWDRPVITAERQQLMNTLSNAGDQARLLAVTSPHSSE